MINKKMELILFEKYLIRTDDYNYILQVVKEDKQAIVTKKINKNHNVVPCYDNFKAPTFFTKFTQVLKKIKEIEIMNDDIKTLDELINAIHVIDKKIEYIKSKFE